MKIKYIAGPILFTIMAFVLFLAPIIFKHHFWLMEEQ